MFKELGTFEVTSGKVLACDPCYDRSEMDNPELDGLLPGRYIADIRIKNTGIMGERVFWLRICHENYLSSAIIEQGLPFTTVPVDSGQAGFFDDEFYPTGESTGDYDDVNTFYGKACELTLSEDQGGIIGNFGVVSSSGYGDGVYGVYVGRNQSGYIVAAVIDYGISED